MKSPGVRYPDCCKKVPGFLPRKYTNWIVRGATIKHPGYLYSNMVI